MERTSGGSRNTEHPSMTDGFSGRQDKFSPGWREQDPTRFGDKYFTDPRDQQYPAPGRDQQYPTGGRVQGSTGGRVPGSTGGRVQVFTGGRDQFNMVPDQYTPDIRSSFTPHRSIVDRGPGVHSIEEQVQYLANQMNEMLQKVYNALIKKKKIEKIR